MNTEFSMKTTILFLALLCTIPSALAEPSNGPWKDPAARPVRSAEVDDSRQGDDALMKESNRACRKLRESMTYLDSISTKGATCDPNNRDISDEGIRACVYAKYTPVLFLDRLSNRLIHEVKLHQDRLKRDPAYAHQMVEKVILPYINREAMAALTVMRPWRKATTVEKCQFIDEYTHQMVDDYTIAMTNYSNERVKFLPLRDGEHLRKSRVRVKSFVIGKKVEIPLEYRLMRYKGEWRIYDLVVNNISIAKSYHGQFKEHISQKGLSGMIDLLKEKRMNNDQRH